MKLEFIFSLALACCVSCASTIDNRLQLDRVSVQPGQSTKADIRSAFGLPSSITPDASSGLVRWLYDDKAALSGLIVAIPTSVTSSSVTVTAYDVPVSTTHVGPVDNSVVFVFNQEDVLVTVLGGREIQQ